MDQAVERMRADEVPAPADGGRRTAPVRALHVIAGLDEADGGPAYSIPALCRSLGRGGAEVQLFSVKGRDSWSGGRVPEYSERRFAQNGAGVPVVGRLRWSAGLGAELNRAGPGVEIIHDHGVWLMPNVQAGRAAARSGRPLVVSPRGMFGAAALEFSRDVKRVFWALAQGPAIRGAACFHATSEQEYHEIRAFGLTRPVAIIPNGIDVTDADRAGPGPRVERVALSLGRLHPKKGLDGLVRAWAAVEGAHPDWRLRIVGPGERGYDHRLRALVAELGARRVTIEDAIYGGAKTAAYREADVFVLPSLSENFGLTVAEALAAGTPVISTKGAPWGGLATKGCGWWIDHGVEPLAVTLARAMSTPRGTLADMGARGREWMRRDFSWDRAAGDMLAVYRWLARGAQPPGVLRFD
jgi:glycosyltransferase involved in cell wall biosynthesis